MTRVVVDITMSLDGFVTGPHAGPSNGLGDGGEALHDWVFKGDAEDAGILEGALERTGAVILGRNLFDVVDAPGGWSEEMAFGGHRKTGLEPPPNFVVTHRRPEHSRLQETGVAGTVEFVDGLTEAVGLARNAAGDKDVTVMGGGTVCGQCVAEGLADELWIHLAPLILGGGTPLFSESVPVNLEQIDVVATPLATHLHYRVVS